MACGGLWGAAMGIFFHRSEWLGGYGSFRRRLLRLGHIACFGLAFVNLAFAFTVHTGYATGPSLDTAGALFIGALVSMPAVCALAAWKEPFRKIFFIPVGCTVLAIAAMLTSVN